MPQLVDALLESWDRQSTIINNLATLITPETAKFKSGPTEWNIGEHLAHIHDVRHGWLQEAFPGRDFGLPSFHAKTESGNWVSCAELDRARETLKRGAVTLREAVAPLLVEGGQLGPYDHPVFFLQHMIWHEGWHAGAIIQALRANGQEPPESWEEPNVWGLWRTE